MTARARTLITRFGTALQVSERAALVGGMFSCRHCRNVRSRRMMCCASARIPTICRSRIWRGEGFENKIAELFAAKLGWKLEYFSFPQRLGFIRNTLRFKLPGEQYRCDLVIGVPAGYDQVSPTHPYYRSTYALVYPQGSKLEGVHSVEDLRALAPEKLRSLRIGVFDRSPASDWLLKHDLLDQAVPYRMLNADPDYLSGRDYREGSRSGQDRRSNCVGTNRGLLR